MAETNMAMIAIIATLDTKEKEAAYLAECITALGGDSFFIDTGMMFDSTLHPKVSRHELLKAGGVEDLETAEKNHGKQHLMEAMTRGLISTVSTLYAQDEIDGILSIGGAQGSAMSTAAMRALPIGFPKVMVSTIACGTAQFGDYVGTKDIVMIPSICDICGINSITAPIFASACGAVLGMAQAVKIAKYDANKPVVALTMAGITTLGVLKIKDILDEKGFETLAFHCNGVGSVVVDELAALGKLAAVIDVTRHDVSGLLFDGLMKCTTNRFANVYAAGIPVISMPGAEDIVLVGGLPITREDLKEQPYYVHTPFHTHVRTDAEKMHRAGVFVSEQHKTCMGPNAIMVPMRGFSRHNAVGRVIYDEAANRAYLTGAEENKGENTVILAPNMHINDPDFAKEVVSVLEKMMGR